MSGYATELTGQHPTARDGLLLSCHCPQDQLSWTDMASCACMLSMVDNNNGNNNNNLYSARLVI